MAWLRLIRWQNLIIIALTQLLAWWCVVLPLKPELLSAAHFLLLMLSTVLIAAAGYIINDYFDIKIDQINHPETVVLGKAIPRKTAIIAHTSINLVAITAAAYLAVRAHHYEWVLLQFACTVLLWYYSTTYKRRFMLGNVTVSVLTALTVLVLIVYEPVMQRGINLPLLVLIVYSYFAFMLSWIREIIKDMEDMEGDAAEGCVTMPIKRGLSYAARFATVLSILAIIPLVCSAVVLYQYGYMLMAFYAIALLAAPLAAWIWYLWHGVPQPAHYHRCSRMLKIIMVSGICSLLIYKFQ